MAENKLTWEKPNKTDHIDNTGRWLIEKQSGYFFLFDTSSERGNLQVPCNKKRLSLAACKLLAEEIVAGEMEEDLPCPGNIAEDEFLEQLKTYDPDLTIKPIPMPVAESRTKEPKRLRGGTNSEEIDPPEYQEPVSLLKPPKSKEEVQEALNKLMVEKGTNFPNWSDFRDLLAERGIDPADVKQGMITEAEQWAREHAEGEAKKKKGTKMSLIEHLKPGTTFTVPGMTFSIGVLLSLNPVSAKVRITEGCKDKVIDWSLGVSVVVVGKVELEKTPPKDYDEKAPNHGDDLPTKTQSEEVMKVGIDEAKRLLVALGLKATAVNKMSAEKVAKKVNGIPEFLDKAEEVEGDNLKLLTKITDWLSENEGGIEIDEDPQDEEGEANPQTEEAAPVEEQEEEPRPKKRGRKPKEKSIEETKIDERYLINGVEPRFYESKPPETKPLTRKLAQDFKGMAKFPRDRELQKARMEFLRGKVKAKEFYGAEWVSAYCEETKEEYRMNGKHGSHVACEFYDAGQELEGINIIVRRFICPTLTDAAALFSTFDAKQSVRTKQDSLRAFASAMEETSELPDWLITLLTAGLSFAQWEGRKYRSKSVDEQAEVLLAHPDFATWLKDLLADRKVTKSLARAPVIGAMAKTYDKDADAAGEFWVAIRDECDDPKDSPRRRLTSWLLKHKLGGRSDGEGASEREFYIVCLKAWNAWRSNKKTNLTYDKEKDKETLEVV